MDAALLHPDSNSTAVADMPDASAPSFVSAAEFRKLAVSHRRMIRVDRREDLIRGLQDLDTGEVFLIDERRLLDLRR